MPNIGAAPIDDESNSTTRNHYLPVPYKPILLIGLAAASNVSAQCSVTFSIQFEFDVTFRGLRQDPAAVE